MMNYKPKLKEVQSCINEMALLMKMKPLPDALCKQLINHVLYDAQYGGAEGKRSWQCYCEGLITESELVSLLMAHAATKIAGYNHLLEPDFLAYESKDLESKLKRALIDE